MGTIAEFRLFLLDSLKYSSNAESPINRSGNLTTSRHNHLFSFFLFYTFFLFFIFYFIFHIFTESRHYRLICLATATDVIDWPE